MDHARSVVAYDRLDSVGRTIGIRDDLPLPKADYRPTLLSELCAEPLVARHVPLDFGKPPVR
jgi:hypothetical protein